jgi:hypothetical protein
MSEGLRELIAELDVLEANATPGPWAWDSRGEKVNEWALGTAFDKNGQPLSGRFTDDDAIYDEYVCSHEAATVNYTDPEFICALRNAYPKLREAAAALSGDYVRVPREPTERMKRAAWQVNPQITHDGHLIQSYQAMLEAAPCPTFVVRRGLHETPDYCDKCNRPKEAHPAIRALRSRLVEQGEEIANLQKSLDANWVTHQRVVTAEQRAEQAESALREAREKERERCAKFLDGRISGSPGSLQATLVDAEVIQCAKAIRSMTDEQK